MWEQIGTEIILGIIGVVISGLGGLITYLINKFVKDNQLKTILNSLNDLVKNAVAEVYQTYVEALKKGGMFDANAQKEALERCLAVIKANMPKDVQKWLEANYASVEDYLKTLIEANVALLKKAV